MRLTRRIARFALGRPIAPIVNSSGALRAGFPLMEVRQDSAGFVQHLGQERGQTKRLLDALDRPLERWASQANIRRAFPTLQVGDPIRFRQQNAKDKLIGLIRKVRKKSGKTYWSKPQRADAAARSTIIPGQRRIKALADNYDGKF